MGLLVSILVRIVLGNQGFVSRALRGTDGALPAPKMRVAAELRAKLRHAFSSCFDKTLANKTKPTMRGFECIV
jgi:hypothetical protein